LKILGTLFIGFAVLGFACQTPQKSSVISRSHKISETAQIVSDTDMDPYYMGFNFFMPEPDEEELGYPFKDVTLTFSANDKYSVQALDPKLFAEGNVEIIDLTMLTEEDYAMPMEGSRIVSRYKGRRKNHTGMDLAGRSRDPIYATFDGVVRVSKRSDTYGNVIVVRHYNGLETVYSHNTKNLVKVGEEVKAGQQIAVSGRTGRAYGDHLHFEVRINGQHFNPELVFNFQTNRLVDKNLYCLKTGNKIKVEHVDAPPVMLANHRSFTESMEFSHDRG